MARLPPNVERSAFTFGMYRIYDGCGHVWNASNRGYGWLAQPAPNNPARFERRSHTAGTLTALAGLLARRKPTTTESLPY